MAKRLSDNVLLDGVWIGRGTLASEMDQDLVGRIADYCWVDDDGAVPPAPELPDSSPPADPVSGAATMEPPPSPDRPALTRAGAGAEISIGGSEGGPDHKAPTEIPPKGGHGSGKDVWAAYAAANDVEVGPDATRDDIIAALTAKDVPTEAKSAE